jgi:hypothetical protein
MSALLFSHLWQLFFRDDCGYRELIATTDTMSGRLRAIQESFVSSPPPGWTVWLFIITIAAVVFVPKAWSFIRGESKATQVEDNNPEKLFDEMLGVLHLSESDKRLLRQMADQGRLKHPAMCLLSPGMLEWTRELWVQEKGSSYVTEAKTAQIREISVKLYGHHGGGGTKDNE